MSENKIKKFVKSHKLEFSIAVGAVSAITLTCLGIKYIPKPTQTNLQNATKSAIENVTSACKEIPFKNFWSNLTGETLTPTKLGNEVFQSSREINKRLVNFGFQERLPCGEYKLTELGKKFGNVTLKVTKADHAFSNIEWDKRVLDIIFSQDELKQVSEKKEIFSKIISA